ncbi:MAG TPA: energy-coupling factor transporter transmembrane component T [Acidimicrobiales bacterium]|nr:energy-coupling factor transporter transmembrane component T [Acidimicrobiales bacterium]
MSGAPSTSVFARRFAGWRLPRTLHPVAWWLWAICLVVAVTQTTNPLLLALVFVVLGFVVSSRRTEAPWARAFKYYLYVALTVVAIRVVFRSVFGGDVGGPGSHVIFTLPRIPLPAWAAGVQIGGPVTLEGTLSALYSGLKLGCLLCCLGAANALANPKRALRSLPGALYELGVAAVVTFNVGPQLVEGVQRVRRARKLRGGSSQKFHVLRSIAIPVLEDAFDRSLRLAAAMDSRGFGRTDNASRALRRTTGALMIIGLLLVCVGVSGLIDPSASWLMGPPLLVAGALVCTAGLVVGSRRVGRTSYRPDPWKVPESLAVATGVVPAVVLLVSLGASPSQMNPPFNPITWPSLPLVPAIAIVVAGLAGIVTPPPPKRSLTRTAALDGEPSESRRDATRPTERVEVSA